MLNRITVELVKEEKPSEKEIMTLKVAAAEKFREQSDVELTWSLYKQMLVFLEHNL